MSRVKSKGLFIHSLILNSFADTISSAYDIQRLIAGLLNKYLMSASQTGKEKSESGKYISRIKLKSLLHIVM
jgi:hypothetical protein